MGTSEERDLSLDRCSEPHGAARHQRCRECERADRLLARAALIGAVTVRERLPSLRARRASNGVPHGATRHQRC
jgi:hypothetical protein